MRKDVLRGLRIALAGLGWSGAFCGEAEATHHLWEIVEVYSNEDGSVQFLELFTSANAQNQIGGSEIFASSFGFQQTFVFSTDLPANTAGRSLLIATSGFASLPRVVTPDFVVPGSLFDPTQGLAVIEYRDGATTLDRITFELDSFPTDGVQSLNTTSDSFHFLQLNSPTNFAGVTGHPEVPEPSTFMPLVFAFIGLGRMRRRRRN